MMCVIRDLRQVNSDLSLLTLTVGFLIHYEVNYIFLSMYVCMYVCMYSMYVQYVHHHQSHLQVLHVSKELIQYHKLFVVYFIF